VGKFAKNFGASLLLYFVISFLGFMAFWIFQEATRVPYIIIHTVRPRIVPVWVYGILWGHIIISITLCFFMGTKLKTFGNHLLNFLSVSGSLLVGLWIMHVGSYMLILAPFSFLMLAWIIYENTNSIYIAITVISLLPPLITSLGIMYKSRQE